MKIISRLYQIPMLIEEEVLYKQIALSAVYRVLTAMSGRTIEFNTAPRIHIHVWYCRNDKINLRGEIFSLPACWDSKIQTLVPN